MVTSEMAIKSAINKPVKVLLYYPDFGSIGGIERYLQQISSRLKEGNTIEPVMVCSASGPLYQSLLASGIKVYGIETLSVFRNPHLRFLDLNSYAQLKQILDIEHPNVVHVHIGAMENLFFKVLGYPTVMTVHGYGELYSIPEGTGFLKQCLKLALLRPMFAWASRFYNKQLFVSHAEHQRLLTEKYLTPSLNQNVMHNGLSVDDIQNSVNEDELSALKTQLTGNEQRPIISFINRLDANKNPMRFVELAEILSEQCKTINLSQPVFVVAGSGPLETAVASRIGRSPIREHFRLVGYQQSVYPLMAASDLLVHLPQQEGFGLIALEALALGIPILASRVGGLVEILDTPATAGLLINADDLESVSQCCIQLLQQSEAERQRLREQLNRRALDFDINGLIAYLETLYQDLSMHSKCRQSEQTGQTIQLQMAGGAV